MMKILLVDDDIEFRNYMRCLLEEKLGPVEIQEGENGQEAIVITKQFHPELVFMDITMPGLNGLESTREIHRLMPECKIIMLTVHTDPAFAILSRQAGASGYLIKNHVDQDVFVAIEKIMRNEWFESAINLES